MKVVCAYCGWLGIGVAGKDGIPDRGNIMYKSPVVHKAAWRNGRSFKMANMAAVKRVRGRLSRSKARCTGARLYF